MRQLPAFVFAAFVTAACASTPDASRNEPPPGPSEPALQDSRPMDPVAGDAQGPLSEVESPAGPERPGDQPLAAAGTCTPVETIDDPHTGKVTFYKGTDGTVSFSADMDVNTDGALTSYSATDPGFFNAQGKLSTRRALNTICNGLKVVGKGERPDLGPRECRQLLVAFAKFRDAGWPRVDAAGDRIRFYGVETRKDAGPDKNEPCLADDDWMISTTSIKMSGTYPACDQQAWLDARRVNAIVMPPQVLSAVGATKGGGDLVVVRYRGKTFGGIVGDVNPKRVGEGTLALAQALRALDPQPPTAPATIQDVYRYSVKRPPVEYFVFPGTKSKASPITNARGAQIAQIALDEAERRGVLSNKACGFDAAGARSLGPIRRLTPEEALNDDPDVLRNED